MRVCDWYHLHPQQFLKISKEKKKATKALETEATSRGLHIDLLPPSEEDKTLAEDFEFSSKKVEGTGGKPASGRALTKTDRLKVKSASIFGGSAPATETKEQIKRRAVQKCLQRGIDPAFFKQTVGAVGDTPSRKKTGSFSVTRPEAVPMKNPKRPRVSSL